MRPIDTGEEKIMGISRVVSAAALVVLGCTSVASAAVITSYGSLAPWQTAAGSPVVLEDFADATLAPGISLNLGGGGSITGGKLSSALAVYGLCINGGAGCPGTTVFNFAPGTTAFGADWDLAPGGQGSGIFFQVGLAGGGVQTISPGIVNPANGTYLGFFGFVSDTAITSIALGSGFAGSGETFDADNVRFRAIGPAVIPEPDALLLVSIGLLALGARRRRRR